MEAPVEKHQASADRRWWLKMLLWSAGLAALLLLLFLGATVGRLHYHAWKYRSGKDPSGTSLRYLAEWATSRHLSRGAVIALLGPAMEEDPSGLHYPASNPVAIVMFGGGAEMLVNRNELSPKKGLPGPYRYCRLVLEDGRVRKAELGAKSLAQSTQGGER